jgi:hypothetical protein
MYHSRPPRRRPIKRFVATVAALTLVATACNGDDAADTDIPSPLDDTTTTIGPDPDDDVDDTTTTTTDPDDEAPPEEDDLDQAASL